MERFRLARQAFRSHTRRSIIQQTLHVLPRLGKWVAGDGDSYRYLAESIRVHPNQAELKAMMKAAGFGHVDVHNLSAGVAAVHIGLHC